jgi:hypothetical protein
MNAYFMMSGRRVSSIRSPDALLRSRCKPSLRNLKVVVLRSRRSEGVGSFVAVFVRSTRCRPGRSRVSELKSPGKPFEVSKRVVWEAWEKVKANQGAPGVDGVSLEEFESDLKNNLYTIWNRMSLSSYFPPLVRAVEIPKPHGRGTRRERSRALGVRVPISRRRAASRPETNSTSSLGTSSEDTIGDHAEPFPVEVIFSETSSTGGSASSWRSPPMSAWLRICALRSVCRDSPCWENLNETDGMRYRNQGCVMVPAAETAAIEITEANLPANIVYVNGYPVCQIGNSDQGFQGSI